MQTTEENAPTPQNTAEEAPQTAAVEQSSVSTTGFKAKRPLIDAITDVTSIDSLSEEQRKNSIQLAKYLASTMNTTKRLDPKYVKDVSNRLFKEALFENVVLTIFKDVIITNPANTDTVAALIGFYTNEYSDAHKKKIINTVIPEEIAKAFAEDNFTTVKRLLHFLGFFVSYNLVTPDSYLALLKSLAEKIEEASDFRREALSHTILFACRTAPEEILDDDIESIIETVRSIHDGSKAFVNRYLPCEESQAQSITDLLLNNCTRFESKCKEYSSLFERATAIPIPEVKLEFGKEDRAPPPRILLTSTYTSVPEYFPVFLDIATDYLTFFETDPEACAHQLLALPITDGHPSLKAEATQFEPEIHTAFAEAIFTAIFSDLLRVPYPTHPIIFYVSVLSHALKTRPDILGILHNVVESIASSFNSLEIGSYMNFIRVLAHFTVNTKQHFIPVNLELWRGAADVQGLDIRKIFIESFISQVCRFSPLIISQLNLPQEYQKFIPQQDKYREKPSEDIIKIRKLLDEEMEALTAELDSQNGKLGEFETLKNLISAVFLPAKSAEQAVKQIENFPTFIHDTFESNSQEVSWKGQVLVEAIFSFFKDSPTIIAQIIVHLITNDYIKLEPYLQYLFDISTKGRIDDLMNWEIFNDIMVCVFQYYNKKGMYDEMKKCMNQLYDNALKLFSSVTQNTLSERLLLGNIRAFTLKYMQVFNACHDDIRGLMSERTNEQFVNFFDKLAVLCQ